MSPTKKETTKKVVKVKKAAVEVESVIPETDAVDAVIRKRIYGAMAIGLVPIPVVDFLALTALHIELVNTLSKMYGIKFSENSVKGIVLSLLGGILPASLAGPLGGSLFKFIPVVGGTLGAASFSLLGGAATYALGKVFDKHFRCGGCLDDFDAEKCKGYFSEKFAEGKDVVANMKSKKKEEAPAEEADADA